MAQFAGEFPKTKLDDALEHLRRPFTERAVKFKIQSAWKKEGSAGAIIAMRLGRIICQLASSPQINGCSMMTSATARVLHRVREHGPRSLQRDDDLVLVDLCEMIRERDAAVRVTRNLAETLKCGPAGT